MSKKRLKCTRCSRTFSMAAHLGRHMSSMHGLRAKTAGQGRAKKLRRQSGNAKTSAPSSIGDSAANLLDQMQNLHSDLAAQAASLSGQMAAIESAISALGGGTPSAAPRRPGRPRGSKASGGRAGSLGQFILNALRATPDAMSPQTIAGAVQKAGYRSKSQDLSKAVSNTLPKVAGVKRVGHGRYTA